MVSPSIRGHRSREHQSATLLGSTASRRAEPASRHSLEVGRSPALWRRAGAVTHSGAMAQRMALYFQDKHPIGYEIEMARYAEERGFSEIWQGDTRLARDCVVMMSALLASTKRLRIASGVLPIYTRNPAVIAASWSTMHELAGPAPDGGSRVMLGLGAWWEPIAGRVGAGRRKPLTAMRENVEAIRALFTMEEVTYEGEFVHLDRVSPRCGLRRHVAPRHSHLHWGHRSEDAGADRGDCRRGHAQLRGADRLHPRRGGPGRGAGAAKSERTIADIDRPELLICSLSEDDPGTALLTGKSLVAYYLGTEPHIMAASGADPELIERVQEVVGWAGHRGRLLQGRPPHRRRTGAPHHGRGQRRAVPGHRRRVHRCGGPPVRCSTP